MRSICFFSTFNLIFKRYSCPAPFFDPIQNTIVLPDGILDIRRGNQSKLTLIIVLKSNCPGNQAGNRYGNQYLGDSGIDTFQKYHDGKCQDSQSKSGPVGRNKDCLEYIKDSFIVMFGTVHLNAEQFGKLGRSNDQGCGIGKTAYYRVRQEVHNHAKSQHTKGKLEEPHQKCKKNSIGDESFTPCRCQRFQSGRRHQGNHGNRTCSELVA